MLLNNESRFYSNINALFVCPRNWFCVQLLRCVVPRRSVVTFLHWPVVFVSSICVTHVRSVAQLFKTCQHLFVFFPYFPRFTTFETHPFVNRFLVFQLILFDENRHFFFLNTFFGDFRDDFLLTCTTYCVWTP